MPNHTIQHTPPSAITPATPHPTHTTTNHNPKPIITGTSHPHVRVLSSPYRSRPIPLIFDCLYNPYTPPPIPPPRQQHCYRSLLSLKYALGKLTCSPAHAHTRTRIRTRARARAHRHTRHTRTHPPPPTTATATAAATATTTTTTPTTMIPTTMTPTTPTTAAATTATPKNHCEISLQTYTAARSMRTPQETHRGNLRQSAPKTHRNTTRKQHQTTPKT